MNKNMKMIIGVIIAIVVVIVAYLGIKYYLNDEEVSTNNTNINNSGENMTLIQNSVENNIEDNTIQENNVIENNTVENEIANKNNSSAQNTISSNNDSEIEADSDEEKALAIVKEDWGSTDGVYFKVQAIDADGNYVISVNNEETTAVLEWYTVNPKTGEFSN